MIQHKPWLSGIEGWNETPPIGAEPFCVVQSVDFTLGVTNADTAVCAVRPLSTEFACVQRIRLTASRLVVDSGGNDEYESLSSVAVEGKFLVIPRILANAEPVFQTEQGGGIDASLGGLSTVGDFGTLTHMAPIIVAPGADFDLLVRQLDLTDGTHIYEGLRLQCLVQGYLLQVPEP